MKGTNVLTVGENLSSMKGVDEWWTKEMLVGKFDVDPLVVGGCGCTYRWRT